MTLSIAVRAGRRDVLSTTSSSVALGDKMLGGASSQESLTLRQDMLAAKLADRRRVTIPHRPLTVTAVPLLPRRCNGSVLLQLGHCHDST